MSALFCSIDIRFHGTHCSRCHLGEVDTDKTVTESETAPPLAQHLTPSERFQRLALLGRGGGGSVYRAFDLKLNREVAIKVPLRCLAGVPEAERSFRREVEATSKLRHPYVVTLHDFELSDHDAILVYEYVVGETLSSYIARFPAGIEPREAAEVVKKIARALHYAHGEHVLHRDIKPSNILLDQQHSPASLTAEPGWQTLGWQGS